MTTPTFLHRISSGLLTLPLGLALSGLGHNAAQAQTLACTAALNSLMTEWQAIGFAEPSKPAQMIVAGQHGYATTGGQFNFMRQEIRASARDCAAGNDASALQHINLVRDLLAHARTI
jgi:hypothetical protein